MFIKLKLTTRNPHIKNMVELFEDNFRAYHLWEVFKDFICMSAMAYSNVVDPVAREEREKTYMKTISKYPRQQQDCFPHIFREMKDAMEWQYQLYGPGDVLGPLCESIYATNPNAGQYFSSRSVSELLSRLAYRPDRNLKYTTVADHTCGAGSLLLGFAKTMQDSKVNYRIQMCATAVDRDIQCVWMAYIQMTLFNIPGVVIHGDVIQVKEWSRWYTPLYILDDWLLHQHCGLTNQKSRHDELLKRCGDPKYNYIRSDAERMKREQVVRQSKKTVEKEDAS